MINNNNVFKKHQMFNIQVEETAYNVNDQMVLDKPQRLDINPKMVKIIIKTMIALDPAQADQVTIMQFPIKLRILGQTFYSNGLNQSEFEFDANKLMSLNQINAIDNNGGDIVVDSENLWSAYGAQISYILYYIQLILIE